MSWGTEILPQDDMAKMLMQMAQQQRADKERKDALNEKQREFNLKQQEINNNRRINQQNFIDKLYNNWGTTGSPKLDNEINRQLQQLKQDAFARLERGDDIQDVLNGVRAAASGIETVRKNATIDMDNIKAGIATYSKKYGLNIERMTNDVENDVYNSYFDNGSQRLNPASKGVNWDDKWNADFLSKYVQSTKPLIDAVKAQNKATPNYVNVGTPEQYQNVKYSQYSFTIPKNFKEPDAKNKFRMINVNPEFEVRGIPLDKEHAPNLVTDNKPYMLATDEDHDITFGSDPLLRDMTLAFVARQKGKYDDIPITDDKGNPNTKGIQQRTLARKNALYDIESSMNEIPLKDGTIHYQPKYVFNNNMGNGANGTNNQNNPNTYVDNYTRLFNTVKDDGHGFPMNSLDTDMQGYVIGEVNKAGAKNTIKTKSGDIKDIPYTPNDITVYKEPSGRMAVAVAEKQWQKNGKVAKEGEDGAKEVDVIGERIGYLDKNGFNVLSNTGAKPKQAAQFEKQPTAQKNKKDDFSQYERQH